MGSSNWSGYRIHLSTAEFCMDGIIDDPSDETPPEREETFRRLLRFVKKAKDAGFMVHVFRYTSTEKTELVDIPAE